MGSGESDSGNKTLVEIWIVIRESGLGQLLKNAYKRESKHQSKGRIINQHSKLSILTFLLCFYNSSTVFLDS